MADVTNSIASNENSNHIKIDSNADGEIQLSEAMQVRYLNIENSNISSLEGINSFINLKDFICQNNLLTSIDVSDFKKGHYIVKVATNKGISSATFIKK